VQGELRTIVRRFAALPRAARSVLVEHILEKGMMERLAFAFPSPAQLSSTSLARGTNHSSLLRIELAKMAGATGLLPNEQVSRIIDEETHFLRMLRFHNLFRSGRIRIDWEYLQREFSEVLEGEFEFLFRDSTVRSIAGDNREVLRNIFHLVSNTLSDLALFDSRTSLEQALSNNLRHGVIVPRFIRAFNERWRISMIHHLRAPRPQTQRIPTSFTQLHHRY
jgi:hypothetical protein